MGLAELRKEVSLSADRQVREINKSADNEAKAILAQAQVQADKLLAQSLEQAKALAKDEERKISSAHLHARKIVAQARDEMISSSISLAREKLVAEAQKQSPAYKNLFERLAKSGVKEFGPKSVISCLKQDAALAKEHADSVKAIDCSGGLVISSSDGKIQLDYTFDSILDENREQFKQIAFNQLFSGKEGKKARLDDGAGGQDGDEAVEKTAKHSPHAQKPVSKAHFGSVKKK
ncbi:hypothetical protein HY993_01245 [Candidatus Micrarchaeota archaeon]|nr:hypothetical protein [Candidatus Micrarchaeota archaeon]